MPVIPALWKAEAGGLLGAQEFETSLSSIDPYLQTNKQTNKKISWVWWCMPVVPATQEAEVGGSFEPERQRLQ